MMNGPAIWFAYSETHEQNEKGWSLRTKYVSCLSVSTRTKKRGRDDVDVICCWNEPVAIFFFFAIFFLKNLFSSFPKER